VAAPPNTIWSVALFKLWRTLAASLACTCPRCQQGALFPHRWTLTVKPVCDVCGLNLGVHDSADGPAVFMIFVLGFALVPLALWIDAQWPMPSWVHLAYSTVLALGVCAFAMQPLKAYVIRLQYKHRPDTWVTDTQKPPHDTDV